MKKIALLTSQNFPELIPDERPLIKEFQERRFKVVPVIWDREQDWEQFDFVIVRNPWDYFAKSEQFLRVLKDINDSSAVLVNNYETMVWNLDKTYLEDFTLEGIPCVPTFKIENFNRERFEDILMLIKTSCFVIKPVVGASGVDTFKRATTLSKEEMAHMLEVFHGRDILIQPYMPNIVEEGEISFIFFNERFSHAVKKTAKSGEFRIQEEHGGRVESYRATAKEIEEVLPLLKACNKDYFYARVDVVKNDKDKFVLMELELVEPQLFFTWGNGSEKVFVSEFIKCFGR